MARGWRNERRLLESMERRRRRDGPFEGRRPLAPRIGADALPGEERVEDDEDEEQRRAEGDVRTDRGDEVPAGKGVRIVADAPRHARHPEEMHREEGEIDADEGRPEMDATEGLVVLP